MVSLPIKRFHLPLERRQKPARPDVRVPFSGEPVVGRPSGAVGQQKNPTTDLGLGVLHL